MNDVTRALHGDHEAAERPALVPCKCCGKPVLKNKCLIEHNGWGKSCLVYWVRCPDCGAETKHYREDSESAVREWNTRAAVEMEGEEAQS